MDSPLLKLPNTFRAFYGAFPSLFPFQIRTIDPILQGRDLILQSGTGSGKTEGVLAPCLERVILSRGMDRLVYVVPTRALAFDLKRRLAPVITPRLGLGLGVRTGDMKRRGGRTPHLMITTPESLDVMLGSRNSDIREFVAHIRMVIIDEVHPLVHQYRGRQLALVLQRLERRTGRALQKIALSATIGDMVEIERFFDFRERTVRIFEDVQKEIMPHLVHIKNETDELISLFDDLYHHYQYRKILLFANSRNTCDRLFALLGGQGAFGGACGLHYSNLKSERRRAVERRFRQNPHALCVATSTLELGIDVGDVDAVVLYEPPDSVSAFLQRIGRANREQEKTVFWAICRGAVAGEQLTRFLGLLALARRGMVEKPVPKKLYSVLCQQAASCIYEKGRISSGATKDLFPQESRVLDDILNTMKEKGWLSEGPVRGLFQGGWQYTGALLEHEIWSNFPPAEEDYSLVLQKKTIADIPKGLVAQLEPGDRVNLAGKRLLITDIIHSRGAGQVLAEPATRKDVKELFWLSPGQQVSYETARSVREVVKGATPEEAGLFSRTRALLHKERENARNAATLKNGIEVILTPAGFYRYLTYLGSVGNLILRWTMRYHLNLLEEEDVYVASDAMGVVCSHWVDFSKLPLPRTRDDLTRWTRQNFKLLKASFPLNRFCTCLPQNLHMAEMADFLFDERIMDAFCRYQDHPSDILSGSLDFVKIDEEATSNPLENIPAASQPLLKLEKARRHTWSHALLKGHEVSNRPLTAGILAGYFRHFQCERFLRFHFLPPHLQPPTGPTPEQKELEKRLGRGRKFEETVMDHLRRIGAAIISIPARDNPGNLRSLKRRYGETRDAITRILSLTEKDGMGPRYFYQGVLLEKHLLQHVEGVGIPDLIRVSGKKEASILMVGDIKSSGAPRFHHQWQVAFYAYLLKKMTASMGKAVSISNQGFLLLPAEEKGRVMARHQFDLDPFFNAFPALLQNLNEILLKNAGDAAFHLKSHCTACPWFEYCYTEALHLEDIRFLPNLSAGQLNHLKSLHLDTLQKADQWLKSSHVEEMYIPAHTHKQLKAKIEALAGHCFVPTSDETRLYPANISHCVILFTVSEQNAARMGLYVADNPGGTKRQTWEIKSEGGTSQWQDFVDVISAILDRESHIFSFGGRTSQTLLKWAKEMGTLEEYGMIENMVWHHWTDLEQVFKTHFALPIPGKLTLHALCHVLGLANDIKRPYSLFHSERHSLDLKEALWVCHRLRKWLMTRLKSTRHRNTWKTNGEKDNPSKTYVQFVEDQQQLRQEDIASLQACTFKERVDRFRALGPIRFKGKELDLEGKFQYNFSMAPDLGTSKFREGDFLKLAHSGIGHLQDGFSVILNRFDPSAETLSISSRQGPLALNRRISYSLEEDAEDWNTPKMIHGIKTVFGPDGHPASCLLQGRYTGTGPFHSRTWVKQWLDQNQKMTVLNGAQQKAMELVFQKGLCLIDGPPGTGKTHLLGWILIALILSARESGKPSRILVSALTHQAIDNVLFKVSNLLKRFNITEFPASLIKWGETREAEDGEHPSIVQYSNDPRDILKCRYLILGATGYGLYRLFDSQNGRFPRYFHWTALDEASQMLVPQAALALAYGKGNYLFLGDVKQLPPIVLSRDEGLNRPAPYPEEVQKSFLEHLHLHYGPEYRVRLNVTYRMNRALCQFPSRTWYDGELHPAPSNAESKLRLAKEISNDPIDRLIDPDKQVTLGIIDHQRHHQECEPEADLISHIACRLITHFAVKPEQIAIISPHRAQNNRIRTRLLELLKGTSHDMPLIDTVERVQGAERDVIIFGFTTSDRDHVTSPFLNNPKRFNVVITRARKKLIAIGSRAFFQAIPNKEADLKDNACFKKFFIHCKDNDSLFSL